MNGILVNVQMYNLFSNAYRTPRQSVSVHPYFQAVLIVALLFLHIFRFPELTAALFGYYKLLSMK